MTLTKSMYLFLFLLLASCAANAQAISSCGIHTGAGSYYLTNNISTTGTTCLAFYNVNDTSSVETELDCQGYSITSNQLALTFFSSTANIRMQNCTVITTNTSSYRALDVQGASTYSGHYFTERYNTFIGDIYYGGNGRVYSNNSSVTDGFIYVVSNNHAQFYYDTIDNSASSRSFGGAITFSNSNDWDVQYTTITGKVLMSYPYGNVDDGILASCGNGYGSPCSTGVASNNNIIDMWDAGVELTGPWTSVTVDSNTMTRMVVAGFGCYGVHTCSIDSSTISNNTVTAGNSSARLFYIDLGQNYGSFLTGNTFSGNSIDSSTASIFGNGLDNGYGTVSSNTITNNLFGSSATVFFQNTGGFSDGGSNYCSAASPAAITCH